MRRRMQLYLNVHVVYELLPKYCVEMNNSRGAKKLEGINKIRLPAVENPHSAQDCVTYVFSNHWREDAPLSISFPSATPLL